MLKIELNLIFTNKVAGVIKRHITDQKQFQAFERFPIIPCISFKKRREPYTQAIKTHSDIAINKTDQFAAYLSINCNQYMPLYEKYENKIFLSIRYSNQ